MAGHWSRLAIAPLMAQVMTAGSSMLMGRSPGCFAKRNSQWNRRRRFHSYRDDAASLPWPLDALRGRHLERPADRGPRLAGIDDVVDHRVTGGDVDVDDLAELLDQLLALGRGIIGLL